MLALLWYLLLTALAGSLLYSRMSQSRTGSSEHDMVRIYA